MEREEAKAVLYEWQKMMVRNGVPLDTSKVQALRVAIEALQADAVRCKECKHYRAEYGSCTAEHWDLSRVTFPHVEPNDYCSYGENKK